MITTYTLYTIAFIVLFIGSYTDFKKREVADTINYGFLFIVLSIKLVQSIYTWNYIHIMNAIIGGGIFFIIACIMFYTGQWGGGDSKMLMGLGALFGFSIFQWNQFQTIELFLINTLILGGIYGLIYTIITAVKHKSKFKQRFKHNSNKKIMVRWKRIIIIACVILFISSFFVADFMLKVLMFCLILFLILSIYLYLFAKSVEESAMLKHVKISELTEGDWIVDDVIVDGKKITGPKDLGIEKEQINKLKELEKHGKIDKILIKIGIPFVPSFLVSFLVTILFGNWLVYLV